MLLLKWMNVPVIEKCGCLKSNLLFLLVSCVCYTFDKGLDRGFDRHPALEEYGYCGGVEEARHFSRLYMHELTRDGKFPKYLRILG